ncbi:ATP-binding protein [Streptomyces collinus]|uniref:ATP-binding protein n=1 Tax=Streptomyces collinus TaxID=42684 RepID=UPI0029426AFA|nr:ATP-binding protein [Streptomyces collinus]
MHQEQQQSGSRLSALVRDDTLVLEVEDNGRGRNGEPEGAGLAGMRELAAQVGGILTITTPSGGGTRVEARLPLADRARGRHEVTPPPCSGS